MKFLVIALDLKTHQDLHKKGGIQSFYDSTARRIDERSQKFRSNQFNVISRRKMEAVYRALALKYDVIFVDTDVVLLNDPLPYLRWNNVDYVHAVNIMCPR